MPFTFQEQKVTNPLPFTPLFPSLSTEAILLVIDVHCPILTRTYSTDSTFPPNNPTRENTKWTQQGVYYFSTQTWAESCFHFIYLRYFWIPSAVFRIYFYYSFLVTEKCEWNESFETENTKIPKSQRLAKLKRFPTASHFVWIITKGALPYTGMPSTASPGITTEFMSTSQPHIHNGMWMNKNVIYYRLCTNLL